LCKYGTDCSSAQELGLSNIFSAVVNVDCTITPSTYSKYDDKIVKGSLVDDTVDIPISDFSAADPGC